MRRGKVKRGNRGQIHNGSALVFLHFVYDALAAQECPFQIGVENPIPVCLTLVSNRFDNNDPRVVD